ncbi:type IV secretion system protein VirB10 [Plesiomonas shigelloides]|uniref:type IV secretion system protein VirB10 n=1 Tax=Plesiomonas shigelloides TaxID=703 RepID=UPI001261486E|nr:type IV secretion system protein VirB10 [Plesiomonas shigelloides]KAB7693128.1 hypothetical protein GBN28_01300 [Plesiomonas shigelloides]
MSQEQQVTAPEHEPDAKAVLNGGLGGQATRGKQVVFVLACLGLLGGLGWYFLADNPPAAQQKEAPPTSTYAQEGRQRRSAVGKTFSYAQEKPSERKTFDSPPDEPATATAAPSNSTPETASESHTPTDTPPPPGGEKKTHSVVQRRVFLDRSSSSLSSSQGKGGNSQGGLGLVPKTPATAQGGVFDVYAQQQAASGVGLLAEGGGGSLGAQLAPTQTDSHVAARLFNRDYLLAKGAYIDCVLNTSLNSTVPGMTKCTLTRDVYSDNGATLLLERGSEVTGEYRSNLTQGQARLFVLWDRIKTPHGVVVNLGSPGTDSLGGGGVPGYVETHFWQRFGGAMMLSLIDDVAAYAANRNNSNNNFESSSETAQSMAAEALKNTINIPPTFYKNQGERVGIFIARDLDFSRVYQLQVQQ